MIFKLYHNKAVKKKKIPANTGHAKDSKEIVNLHYFYDRRKIRISKNYYFQFNLLETDLSNLK